MKRFLALALALLMIFSAFVSCGSLEDFLEDDDTNEEDENDDKGNDGSEILTEFDTGMEKSTDTEIDIDIETDLGDETDIEIETDEEGETGNGIGIGTESGTETATDSEVESGSESESNADSESNKVTETAPTESSDKETEGVKETEDNKETEDDEKIEDDKEISTNCTHAESIRDGSHECSKCGEVLTDCTDTNTDGLCDICKRGCLVIITDVEGLKNITLNNADVKYRLANDLDLNGAEWTPIGTAINPFKGTFDGNGHVISNFKITVSVDNAGLFGFNEGIIENLGIKDFSMSTEAESLYLGALIGYNNRGKITNCYSSCNLYGSYIVGGLIGYSNEGVVADCYTSGFVVSNGGFCAGGLIGQNVYGTVMNCYSSSEVVSGKSSIPNAESYTYAGGLIGYLDGYIVGANVVNCYATGKVSVFSNNERSYAGGFIGFKRYGTVMNSYATGDIDSISNSDYNYTGGFVGYNEGEIINCFAVGILTLSNTSNDIVNNIGALVAYNESATNIVNSYVSNLQCEYMNVNRNGSGAPIDIENLKSKSWVESNLWLNEIDLWNFSFGYPVLDRTELNTFVDISSKSELISLSGKMLTRKYRLTVDLDIEGSEWLPIETFFGVFDGNNHKIYNFKISSNAMYAGLFAKNKGIIKNLGVESFTISGEADEEYENWAAGLVANNKGISAIVENCYAKGSVMGYSNAGGLVANNEYGATVMNSFAECVVRGAMSAGGLVGYNEATLLNCYSNCDVFAGGDTAIAGGLVAYNQTGVVMNCYSTGRVRTDYGSIQDLSAIGGLIGANHGKVDSCYSTCDITTSFGVGYELNQIGGLIGFNNSQSEISNCYRCEAQKLVASGNQVATNANAIGASKSISEVKSISFQASTLGWSADEWIFADGAHPILKI